MKILNENGESIYSRKIDKYTYKVTGNKNLVWCVVGSCIIDKFDKNICIDFDDDLIDDIIMDEKNVYIMTKNQYLSMI